MTCILSGGSFVTCTFPISFPPGAVSNILCFLCVFLFISASLRGIHALKQRTHPHFCKKNCPTKAASIPDE